MYDIYVHVRMYSASYQSITESAYVISTTATLLDNCDWYNNSLHVHVYMFVHGLMK